MQSRWLVNALCLSLLVAVPLSAGHKKKEEKEINQTLELPKDLPMAVAADASQLRFLSAPLTGKGLLSQQTREGIRALWRNAHGATIVRLRAFVAGTGDVRRVQTIVSEEFSEKKQPLPVLSVIQVGALPFEAAQIALDAVAVEKRAVNPAGVRFFTVAPAINQDPESPTLPLVEESLKRMQGEAQKASIGADDVLQVTCYVSLLPDAERYRQAVAQVFPQAVTQLVQVRRAVARASAECEGVGRASAAGVSKLAFTGLQLSFQDTADDVKLAFTRLNKALEPLGTNLSRAVYLHLYPLSASVTRKAQEIEGQFVDKAHPPTTMIVPCEGLPSLDATLAMDVVVGAQ